MKALILSDTHGVLRPETEEQIKNSDAVIHGGDIASKAVLEKIKSLMKPDAPLFAVRGNNDRTLTELPDSLEFELGGLKFFLVHNKRDIPKNIDADIIIFGHSHKYFEENINGRLWLNPGSCGRRRFNLPLTMAALNICENGYDVEKIDIAAEGKSSLVPERDLLKIIQMVMRGMDKRESAAVIAERLRLDVKFVEQIMQLRVTHPRIDADGIMNKMMGGLNYNNMQK